MDNIIFSVPRSDLEKMEKAFDVWGIGYKHPPPLAFDSAEPVQWVNLLVEIIKSPAAMNCLSAAIGYFIARNRGKTFEVTLKNGTRITIKGFDLDETITLLDKATHVEVKDRETESDA
ncbi:hypothetical protein DOE63_24155 [Salmonella enterica subsp. diarizonae serovar 59:z10:-]|nr:hypothetical protein DOE63_24155 [Salmonella enterica subsp. diarizonae serovar 59:z10:-]